MGSKTMSFWVVFTLSDSVPVHLCFLLLNTCIMGLLKGKQVQCFSLISFSFIHSHSDGLTMTGNLRVSVSLSVVWRTTNPVIRGQPALQPPHIHMRRNHLCPGGDMFSLELMALTRWRLWEPDLAVWCIQERARGLPTVQDHRGTALSFSCLLTSNGETMGSPPEGWPVFVACVFVLHQVFTQNTSAPLRTRSAHPSNLLCRQRHSVPPPPEQRVTQSDPLATQRKLLSAVLSRGAASVSCQRLCFLTEAPARTEQSVQTVRPRVALSKVSQSVRDDWRQVSV